MIEWRSVEGFEGLYEVSNMGDIRNLRSGKLQSKNKAGAGYIKADFWDKGRHAQTTVHRVVAAAFLSKNGCKEVNHKNGIRHDNRVENLEWVTRSANTKHSCYQLGALVKPVVRLHPETGEEKHYPSIETAIRDGFGPNGLYRCLYGIQKCHKGFSWRFVNPEHKSGKKVTRATLY